MLEMCKQAEWLPHSHMLGGRWHYWHRFFTYPCIPGLCHVMLESLSLIKLDIFPIPGLWAWPHDLLWPTEGGKRQQWASPALKTPRRFHLTSCISAITTRRACTTRLLLGDNSPYLYASCRQRPGLAMQFAGPTAKWKCKPQPKLSFLKEWYMGWYQMYVEEPYVVMNCIRRKPCCFHSPRSLFHHWGSLSLCWEVFNSCITAGHCSWLRESSPALSTSIR